VKGHGFSRAETGASLLICHSEPREGATRLSAWEESGFLP